MSALLSIRGVTMSFGSTRVLDHLDLDVCTGQVLGLMGPNGAGKSTLIRILDGVYRADAGRLLFDGEPVASLRGHPAVGFVHQDPGLVEALSIADNMRLGQPRVRWLGPILDTRRERHLAEQALAVVGLHRPVTTPVSALSPGEKTLVALARLRSRGARLLVVDEATSTLPPADAAVVIDALRAVAADDGAVILVSHKLNEILDATDRIVLMIDGTLAADQLRASIDRSGLVELLLEHDTGFDNQGGRTAAGAAALRLIGAGNERCGPIDLTVHRGEVVGLTGLPGSGLHDIAFLAAGIDATTDGAVVSESARRTALIPPHRETEGGFDQLSTRINMTVSALGSCRRSNRLIDVGRERREADTLMRRLRVVPNHLESTFGDLSGGNKQKVIFGRALMSRADVLVLCEPTRGVDLATRYELYRLIREMAAAGAAILLASSDAEDLFAVCDRVGVANAGRLGDVRPIDDLAADQIEALV